MLPLQLTELVSAPGLLGLALGIVGLVIVVRFVVGLAIKLAIIGLVILGAVMVLNQLLGLGLSLPILGGLTVAA
jgi:hypothetical protein